jgi:outer membrane protein OmpA-like peptidoglycan-associated protein
VVEHPTPEEELKRLLLSSELDLLATLEERLSELQGRFGDDAALQETLRRVIVDVLRDAGAQDHERLSMILAPLMLSSLRAEIRSSRDMMVEALYPITGRLVSTAVKNAFRNMLANLDSRVAETLSLRNLRLRAKALITGRSYAEMVLGEQRLFHIQESLVIHRSTGLLITRIGPEDEAEEEVDRDLVGSMLNAVMSLTRDAFGDDESGELSTLEFGDAQLLIKSSPTLILVVVVRGAPPASLAGRLDGLFVEFLEQWGGVLSDFDGGLELEQEIGLVEDVRHRVAALHAGPEMDDAPRRSIRRPAAVLALVTLVLLAWAATGLVEGRRIRAVEASARAVVDRQAPLAGYPIDVRWDQEQELLSVGGLTPDADARAGLEEAIRAEIDAPVSFTLNVLPDPTPPADPIVDLERFAELNAIYFAQGAMPRTPERAESVLTELAEHLLATPPYVRLRIIGYADPLGSEEVNALLTLQRARFAYDRLIELGVPEERLVTVGRPGERLASQTVGAGSDSRRTEFEVYFTES